MFLFSDKLRQKISNKIERKFDKIHKFADRLPLAPLDGIIHGTSKGIFNWLLDKHPENKETKDFQIIFPDHENGQNRLTIPKELKHIKFYIWWLKTAQDKNWYFEQVKEIFDFIDLKHKGIINPQCLEQIYEKLGIRIETSITDLVETLEPKIESILDRLEKIEVSVKDTNQDIKSIKIITEDSHLSIIQVEKLVKQVAETSNRTDRSVKTMENIVKKNEEILKDNLKTLDELKKTEEKLAEDIKLIKLRTVPTKGRVRLLQETIEKVQCKVSF